MQGNAQTRDYADLVNPHRIRHTIRRLFSGSVAEILSELLQNSQRAGARTVTVTARDGNFTFEDDGHGITGLGGFHTLLRLADSGYDNPAVSDQDPMGVGVNSLLASDRVTAVTVASGGTAVDIDTARWWSDPEYFETWADRVRVSDFPARGLALSASVSGEFVREVSKWLSTAGLSWHDDGRRPARGYDGILDVTFNGEPVDTSLPFQLTHAEVDIVGEYEGCPVSISAGGNYSAIVWYGQIIHFPSNKPFSGFSFVMHVQHGRPVNPMSPARTGIIEDAKLSALVSWVEDRIFEHLCNPARRDTLSPEFVRACHQLDRERAARVSPVFVASPYTGAADQYFSSTDDVSATGNAEVVAYGEGRLLVCERIEVRDGSGEVAFASAYGLDGFLPLLGRQAYRLDCGSAKRADVAQVVWVPGSPVADTPHGAMFRERGHWALSGSNGVAEKFEPVTADCVWAFDEPSAWDVDDVDWVVAATDRVRFFERTARAAFDPDTDDYAACEESYERSLDSAVRRELGRSVPSRFSYEDLASVVSGEVASVAFVRDEAHGSMSLAVTLTDGTVERVSLYG